MRESGALSQESRLLRRVIHDRKMPPPPSANGEINKAETRYKRNQRKGVNSRNKSFPQRCSCRRFCRHLRHCQHPASPSPSSSSSSCISFAPLTPHPFILPLFTSRFFLSAVATPPPPPLHSLASHHVVVVLGTSMHHCKHKASADAAGRRVRELRCDGELVLLLQARAW